MGDTVGDHMQTNINGNGKCLSIFVDTGSTESHRYYLSRRTLLQMIKDRGYDIATSDIEQTLQQFRDVHGQTVDIDRLRISATHVTDPENKIHVNSVVKYDGLELISAPLCGEWRDYGILAVSCGTGAVKVNVIRWIATHTMNKESLNRLIIVVQSHITNQAMKAITDLLVNITKHVLKPKHRVITDVEKEKLLRKFNLNENQLPRMSQKDAIAQYYGLEKGQVIEVTYNGEITGLHVTYRCIW